MGLNFVEDELHQAFALITQSVVDVTALDQKHVHSDFERHGLSDLVDAVLVHVDFSLELFSVDWLLVDENLDSFSFFKDEKELIVNVGSQADNFKVLFKSLRNLLFGLDNDFIINLDIPKMHLVTSGDGVLWSWEVATLLHNLINNLLKLLLNLFNWGIKQDFLASTALVSLISIWNTKLKGDEVIFERSIGIILSLDDIIWLWISWEFVSLNELHIGVDRLLNEFSDLVSHEGSS